MSETGLNSFPNKQKIEDSRVNVKTGKWEQAGRKGLFECRLKKELAEKGTVGKEGEKEGGKGQRWASLLLPLLLFLSLLIRLLDKFFHTHRQLTNSVCAVGNRQPNELFSEFSIIAFN
jgi:hypothetical protein